MTRAYPSWGNQIEQEARAQMDAAMSLPVTVAGALMPDAHVGYGLPIGGVLATEGAVIPYAVGVDIACRMMMTIFDVPPAVLGRDRDFYVRAIEKNTRFGIGAAWKDARTHPVMDEDWSITPFTASLREKAASQLGTSGSGNHFVEFVDLTLDEEFEGIPRGRHMALLSHSGSRNAGAQVAAHYSRLAMKQHGDLTGRAARLAWLDMAGDGAEYWAAMSLMGRYASANHHVIHEAITRFLDHGVLGRIENHHNFAWRETLRGRDVIVHRKGATPAPRGVAGIIPGSMGTPGFLVEGLGNADSLSSTSHGAGRAMSRTAAAKSFSWKETNAFLAREGVELISAGLDEVPWAYKDITAVMDAQKDLARTVGRFMPRLVKMAPSGERPED
ncbi:MAG TPA: RtcB family protein [Bacteroidota bacterium]|nr:RtcB family protein [Bacteroidota bacterium]